MKKPDNHHNDSTKGSSEMNERPQHMSIGEMMANWDPALEWFARAMDSQLLTDYESEELALTIEFFYRIYYAQSMDYHDVDEWLGMHLNDWRVPMSNSELASSIGCSQATAEDCLRLLVDAQILSLTESPNGSRSYDMAWPDQRDGHNDQPFDFDA